MSIYDNEVIRNQLLSQAKAPLMLNDTLREQMQKVVLSPRLENQDVNTSCQLI